MSGIFKRPSRGVRRKRSQIRAEVDEELRFHVETLVSELVARGLTPAAARAEALRRFGDYRETEEVCVSADERRELKRERRRFLDEVWSDVRHGARQMRRRASVSLLAIGTLAVGVGATTAIFSAMDHVLLRPLPYDGAERVMTLWETDTRESDPTLEVSAGNFHEWKQRSTVFEAMGLAEPTSFDLSTEGRPEAVPVSAVTEGYLEALGARPIRGRRFTPEDYLPNASPVVLISHGMWQQRFGGASGVVGETLRLDGGDATIVGVMPPSTKYPEPTDLWAPKVLRAREQVDRVSQYMAAVGRLKPGVTAGQAQADLSRVASHLAAEYPSTNATLGVRVVPLRERLLGSIGPTLLTMFGAVTLVLLIACANVAGLMLAAGMERGRELAVRASLGASRGRLLLQLVTESLLLAAIGGLIGIGIAYVAIRGLVLLSPPDLPRFDEIGLDGRVLAFALVLVVLTALLSAIAPALRFSRPDLNATLRGSSRSATAGPDRQRARGVLVAAQVSLALVLLVGAGLLMRSFVALTSNDLGFAVEDRVSLQVFLWDLNPTEEQRARRIVELEETFRATPGVVDAGVVSALPFHPHQIASQTRLAIEGRPVAGELPSVNTALASAGYFTTMEIPLKAGRLFDDRDRADAPPVVLINEALARRFFPGEDPLGRMITLGATSTPRPREIIGIVGDVRPVAHDSDPRPEVFVPFSQVPSGSATFVVHAEDAAAKLPMLRDRLWSVDDRQSIYHSATVEQLVGRTLVERRLHLVVLGAFSLLALVLASVGIYGVVGFMTAQRVNEIGVRMALGAQRPAITRMILASGLRLVLPGILIGLAAALALTRFLASMLYGVAPTDALTFVQVSLLLVLVAVAAAYVPARRVLSGSPIRQVMQ
ncbi:MAG: ABC transporter permease [Gemmatimonadetes bacterium]|nr:ABC transporter permease [Gemmatimonadota bacterium]